MYPKANKIFHLNKVIYTWRNNPLSVSNQFDKRQLAAIKHREERMRFMDAHQMDLADSKWAYTDNVGYFALVTAERGLAEARELNEKWQLAKEGVFPFLQERET
ncbi:hypothetical protein BVE84_07350 [Streptococcus azizii]|uniref:Uncharacterized protein n=1 Tax=Streptococcus azizii TaxID=1579424 RepID=A0AB36JT00_9STRE|nr:MULTISPECIES: hypothetical protein [Streptococcus]MBF0777018.1 hypothetical protein [Streptococcus sp. 19428wD3_AN2]ONK25460.1 hypothetical protein BVE85_10065 [Streptococcus azizii]ONK27252.1 hypothetical protein BVE86_05360 [Streptococcus azizii]ONK27760.1 hypothetical protein BVE84_07350 [Streptococcus azizii]TFU81832.1 hypothetical protein E4T83_09720 [Streptococcus sp. AN2]